MVFTHLACRETTTLRTDRACIPSVNDAVIGAKQRESQCSRLESEHREGCCERPGVPDTLLSLSGLAFSCFLRCKLFWRMLLAAGGGDHRAGNDADNNYFNIQDLFQSTPAARGATRGISGVMSPNEQLTLRVGRFHQFGSVVLQKQLHCAGRFAVGKQGEGESRWRTMIAIA